MRHIEKTFLRFCLFAVLLVPFWAQEGDAFAQKSDPTAEAGLGHYDPQEQVGHVVLFELPPEEPSFLESSSSFSPEVIRLVNQKRRGAGLLPLKPNPILNAMAQAHSDHMRRSRCFAHQCAGEFSPAERICLSGYGKFGGTQSLSDASIEAEVSGGPGPGPGRGSCFIGEAIAAGYTSPAAVVSAWMASPPHQAILLHPKLREAGVGFASGGAYRAYWTFDAGSQPNVLPVFINYDDVETHTPSITLSLSNEEVSGFGGIDYAREVAISNGPGFSRAVWEAYAPHKPWALTQGPGIKTVYVKYKDPKGLEILSVDDILLR